MCFAEVFVKFWVFQPNREADKNALREIIIYNRWIPSSSHRGVARTCRPLTGEREGGVHLLYVKKFPTVLHSHCKACLNEKLSYMSTTYNISLTSK